MRVSRTNKKPLRNRVLKKGDFHKKPSTRSGAKFLIKKNCVKVKNIQLFSRSSDIPLGMCRVTFCEKLS